MRLEQRIMIGAEMARGVPPTHGGVEHAAKVGASDRTAVHADADEATRALVHDHEHPVAPEHDGLASKRSTLHRLSVVWPMNDTHEGPVPPGMGRECVDSTRYTTCLSMLAPNVRELMRAIRGQPNRGVRDTCLCGTRAHAEERGPARARRHPLMPGPSAPGLPTSAGERGGLRRCCIVNRREIVTPDRRQILTPYSRCLKRQESFPVSMISQ